MPHATSPNRGQTFDPAEPIAVVGMAMRFPGGATDSKRFWDMLQAGRSAHGPVPKSRFNMDGYYHPDGARTGSMNIKGSYFLEEDPFYFDAPFFSMTANEANGTDGQQRLMLEVAYEAMENAGIPMHSVIGSETGVYVGCFTKDFESVGGRDPFGGPFYAATGNGQSMLSNRLSWFFDLRGPSFTIDTACSSSLYAVHLACQSLRTGETKMAVVGGTNLIYDPSYMRDMVTMTFFSPDGVCHSFDHRANGYARGDGIGGMVLKTVKQALADGDTIRAVIRGTGLNQDGKTPGITMPSPEAQADLIRSTYASARLPMDNTAYFEAHGTGTAIGDPYELSALGATFGKVRSADNPIYVGSVKTNIGHLEGCAGLAGLIKTVLVVEKGQIPPLAGFEKANPRLKLDEWHVALPEQLVPWPEEGVRRASVNSFGYGGANAHVIVDDAYHFLQQLGRSTRGAQSTLTYKSDSDDSAFSVITTPSGDIMDPMGADAPAQQHKLFVFSAADQAGLQRVAKTYSTFLEEEIASFDWTTFMSDLAYTLASRRSLLDHRSFIVANSGDDLTKQLQEGLTKRRRTAKTNNTFMVFSGQGAQWPTMGRELISYRAFRESLQRAENTLLDLGSPWALIEELNAPKEKSRVDSPDFSQPLCTALQLALVDLLRTWGVVPHAVVGHSSGEIAAAYAAGHISHNDAMKVAYLRGVYSADVHRRQPKARGAMMAVGLSPEACVPYIQQLRQGKVVIACINSPGSVTISGDADAIIELETMMTKDDVFARRLRIATAYHSHHMQCIAEDYLESMGHITPPQGKPSNITMFSSVTGAPITAADIDAEYWVKNLLGTVKFADAVKALVTQPVNAKSRRKIFVPYSAMIECGPAEALKGPLNQILAATDEKLLASVPYIGILARNQNAEVTAMKAAGRLWAQGIKVDMSQVNFQGSESLTKRTALVNLPPYPWNHSKLYFHESAWGKKYRNFDKPRTDLLGMRLENQNADEPRWHNWIKLAEQPWLSDHRVQQRILYPGAAMVTMAFEAARELVDPTRTLKGIQAQNILFKRGLMVPTGDEVAETAIHFRTSKNQCSNVQAWEFTVFSQATGDTWQENCTGVVSLIYITDDDQAKADALEWQADLDLLQGITKRATRPLAPETFYKLFDRKMDLQYGTLHQNVTRCIAGTGEGLGTVTIPDTKAIMPSKFEYPHLIHPSTLDSVFHLQALGYLHSLSGDESLIPISIASIYVSADVPTAPGTELMGFSKGTQGLSGDSIGDIVLSDEQWSSPKVVVRGFLSRDMSVSAPQTQQGPDTRSKKCTSMEWVPLRPETAEAGSKESDAETSSVDLAQSNIAEVLILHNADVSEEILTLMINLADGLDQIGFPVRTAVYPQQHDDIILDATGKVVISLVEAEDPVVANWDAEGFSVFQNLVLNAEAVLWLTRGGDAADDKSLQFHVSTGLLRTVRVERPQLKLSHLDIHPKTSLSTDITASLVLEAFKESIVNDADAVEQEFAEVDGKLMVPRVQTQESFHAELGRQDQQSVVEQRLDAISRKLKTSTAGNGKELLWSDNALFATAIASTEVDVSISMIALERSSHSKASISETDAAGTVTAVGSDVTNIAVGDRVVVCGADGLATHARVHSSFVQKVPEFMSLATTAGLPTALCAAEAMLVGSVRLQAGETILVCSLPGTLQQTLVSFATHMGARVFVTSETKSNRRLLEDVFNLPEDQILGSVHSEATWKTLKCIAGVGGVDVVVNTFGDAIEQSMSCLGDFGRFVASGGHKITHVAEALGQNITLATVDIEHMRRTAPARLAAMFARSWDRARAAYLDNWVSGKRFPVVNVEKARDYLCSDKCSGGAVLTLSPQDTISVLPPDAKPLQLDPQATYVLSGGLGGLGRSIADMMFAAGARNITFISRSGGKADEAKRLLESLQERGCNAQAYSCDITDSAAVDAFAAACLARGEVVKGVIQCAMVLRDGMFENMSFKQWTESLAPKVQGTWHLHKSLPADMDFFIMLSSMAGVIGNPGQANYSAAGTYQDALSRHRRANGLASTTIDLGIVSDVGYIAENAAEFERLAYLENLFISERDLHLILSAAMLGETRDGKPVPAQVITGVGKELIAGDNLGDAMCADLKYIHLQDNSGSGEDLVGEASDDAANQALLKVADSFAVAAKIVEGVLVTNLAKSLTMERDDIDLEKPIHAYGVDSLVAVEVRNNIFRKLKADISVFDIMSNMSLTQMVARIVSKSKLVKAEIAAEGAQD